jgi:predicted enzyme related to lactoylglutathione lyase
VDVTETYVMLMVADMDRAVRFWRDGLGLGEKFSSPFWTELTSGSTVIALHGGAIDGDGRDTNLGFRVPDADASVAAVVAAGGTVKVAPSTQPDEGIRLAEVADTEGNVFFLSAPMPA